jgi:hypothetical protein
MRERLGPIQNPVSVNQPLSHELLRRYVRHTCRTECTSDATIGADFVATIQEWSVLEDEMLTPCRSDDCGVSLVREISG